MKRNHENDEMEPYIVDDVLQILANKIVRYKKFDAFFSSHVHKRLYDVDPMIKKDKLIQFNFFDCSNFFCTTKQYACLLMTLEFLLSNSITSPFPIVCVRQIS